MNDIILKISKNEKKIINLDTDKTIIIDGENLQSNLVFIFDEFVNGVARVEFSDGIEKHFVNIDKIDESYIFPIKSAFAKAGQKEIQLVITQTGSDDEIPIFKTEKIFILILDSINAEEIMPEEYPSWIEKANEKLAEIDESIEKSEEATESAINTAEDIKRKADEGYFDGEDGKDALINGVNTLNLIAGKNISAIQEGNVLTIENTYSDEDIQTHINSIESVVNQHELDIANINNDVDRIDDDIADLESSLNHLADNKQDKLIAGQNITIENNVISSTGGSGGTSDYNDLENKPSINNVILEGQMIGSDLGLIDDLRVEEIVDSKLIDYVKNTDYASNQIGGTIKVQNSTGFSIDSNGYLQIVCASDEQIKNKSNIYNPITSDKIDLAVKEGIVNNKITLTDEEQIKVENWLGLAQNYLTRYNDIPYSVTDSYNPAHKKYVDENVETLNSRIDEIELFKFPNATIIGNPTINQGQVSNFTRNDYLEFPFLVDFKGLPFEINFAFTTGQNVDIQQNILDSDFGLAFAIRNKHLVVALSFNGTSWATEQVGTLTLQPQITYRIRITWNRLSYKVQYSIDGGKTYIDDITFGSTQAPYPKQMYIGVGKLADNYFEGIVNLNLANVKVNNELIWQGMDDVGLATRLAIDLSNIDNAGVERIKEIATYESFDVVDLGIANLSEANSYKNNNFAEAILRITNREDEKGKLLVYGNSIAEFYVSYIGTAGGNPTFIFYGTIKNAQPFINYVYDKYIMFQATINAETKQITNIIKIYSKDIYFNKIVTFDNNEAYTPINDYNPATKKYVDDLIIGALEGEY